MRALFLTAALLLAPVLPAWGAPTCQDRDGIATRCGAPGAMPLGWEPSPQELSQRPRRPGPDREMVWTAIAVVGLLFSLIALMPQFDGARDDDWQPPAPKNRNPGLE
jgi:hypothetical protein